MLALFMQSRLYRVAKLLRIGRVLRYVDLWLRYLLRLSESAIGLHHASPSGADAESQAASLASLDMQSAVRMTIGSWFPIDFTDARQRTLLIDVPVDTSHEFAAPVRQIVYLSVEPRTLDLSLQSVRNNLGFINRIVVLTKGSARDAIEAVATRHFYDVIILTDESLDSGEVPAEHTPRNTWLRRTLYRHHCIEANFLAADEDYIALRPVEASYYLNGDIHAGYYFREDMGTWLGGSPCLTSFDGGIRNTWRLLRQAGCPARGFSSHMPQIINKSVCNLIFDKFVNAPGVPAYDEWSLYFNVAGQLCPNHFMQLPYGALGWPLRTGDWFPEVTPQQPAFENYYPQNYARAKGGLFLGLDPLGDLSVKVRRTLESHALAHRVELTGDGIHYPGILGLIVRPDGLKFVATGTVFAGRLNIRRLLLINGSPNGAPMKGMIEMFVINSIGAVVDGESVRLGQVSWIPLRPPENEGFYQLKFFANLDGGGFETRGRITVIE
jgi:hypothetical protein